MLGSALEVVIGLVFVYFVLSLLCSGITDLLQALVKKKAELLGQWLTEVFRDPAKASRFLEHPLVESLIRPGAKVKRLSHIPSRTFAKALFSFVDPELSTPRARREINSAKRKAKANGSDEIAKVVEYALSEAKGELTKVLDAIEQWFNDSMQRVSYWYERWAKRIALGIAVVIALVVNADSVRIATTLWNSPTVRAAVVASAERRAEAPAAPTEADSLEDVGEEAGAAIKELKDLGIPLGWKGWADFTAAFDGRQAIVKIFGLLLTAAALALGAPFWFDLLKRFTSARGALRAPAKEES